ncbi:MAG: hypothetical protein AAB523_00215 [Patescibacteria group bacterium]
MSTKKLIIIGVVIVAVLALGFLSAPRIAPDKTIPPESQVFTCTPEQRNAEVCAQIYQPVCATVNIQCITTPCDPIQETFPNACSACGNPLVSSYIAGECSGTDNTTK